MNCNSHKHFTLGKWFKTQEPEANSQQEHRHNLWLSVKEAKVATLKMRVLKSVLTHFWTQKRRICVKSKSPFQAVNLALFTINCDKNRCIIDTDISLYQEVIYVVEKRYCKKHKQYFWAYVVSFNTGFQVQLSFYIDSGGVSSDSHSCYLEQSGQLSLMVKTFICQRELFLKTSSKPTPEEKRLDSLPTNKLSACNCHLMLTSYASHFS